MTAARLLVAGVGNVFFGDDGFGVEVVRRLAARPLPPQVRVADFGIRSFDLACALAGGHEGAILVDATQRGGPPGTLYVVELDRPDAGSGAVNPHGLDPEQALRLAAELGEVCPRVCLVGCEPLTLGTEEDPVMGLSEPVACAVAQAVRLVESLIGKFLDGAPCVQDS